MKHQDAFLCRLWWTNQTTVITTVERNVSLGLVVVDTLNITLFHSDKTKRLDVFIDE